MIDLRGTRLRSNPRFRLVPRDLLQEPQRSAFESLGADPDFFGILLPPPGSPLPAKAVSRDAALLFLALAEAACLPHLLTGLFGPRADDRLRQLVLDSVLEVEHAGQFVTGPAALTVLGADPCAVPSSRAARLSADAIDYAAALWPLPLDQVAARLYLFNVAPATPALQRRFAADERTLAFLFQAPATAGLLRSQWRSDPATDGWLSWSTGQSARDAGCKLYVSPVLVDLPAVFSVAVAAFARTGCSHFKLGRGASGLLRPDKLVAYFADLDRLLRAADSIRSALHGAAAQGVPFSAPIDPDGLLSWGMDPPRFEQELAGREVQSWRQWLTERVAVYVAAARQAGAPVQSFVRQRVALDGVNPATWSPDLAIWRGPPGSAPEPA